MSHDVLHQATLAEEMVRPTCVEVNLSRLQENFLTIQKHTAPAKIMPVLKANAYGHGLVRVARLMESLNADYLGVAYLEEGVLLRQKGIQTPILVLGGILGNQIPHFIDYDLTLTASSVGKLQAIEAAAAAMQKTARVHLKIDTGMERIGVHYYNAETLIQAAAHCRHVIVEGVFSHLANADAADLGHAKLQIERFKSVLALFKKNNLPKPPLCHLANSAAVLNLPEARFDMLRPGIMLYGVYPSKHVQKTVAVKPALTWKSRIVYFKVIEANTPVGYGSTWQCDHAVRAVTLPVGYGDGYLRAMSNQCEVLIGGKRYSVVGTIAMDQIVVNIENNSAFNGDEVVLLGEMGGETIACEELAQWAGTIPYEILTNINTRVPRVYVS